MDLRSEGLAESLYAENNRLDVGTGEFESDRDEACYLLLGPVWYLQDELCRLFGGYLDKTGTAVFAIGLSLEAGLCPQDVYRHLFITDEPRQSAGEGQPAIAPIGDEEAFPSPADSQLANWIANRGVNPGELGPPEGWRDDVVQRWQELGLPEAEIKSLLPEVIDAGSIESVVEAVNAEVRKKLEALWSGQRGCEQSQTAGYLGLILNDNAREVSRVGGAEVVAFGGDRVSWEVLKRLVREQETPLSREAIEGIWASLGLADTPERGTVDAAVSKVRKLLEPLRVGVLATRKLGWRLVSVDDQPKPASPKANDRPRRRNTSAGWHTKKKPSANAKARKRRR